MTHPSQIALVIGSHSAAERQMLRLIDAAATTTATLHQQATRDRDAFTASRQAWCRHVPALLYPAPRTVGAIAARSLANTVSRGTITDDAAVASVIGRALTLNAAALMAAPTVSDTWLAAAARAAKNATPSTSAAGGGEGGDCDGKQSSAAPKPSTSSSVIADATHFKAVERSFAARGVALEEVLCNGHCHHIPGTGSEALVFPYQQHGSGGGLQGSAVVYEQTSSRSTLFQDWAVLLRRGQAAEMVDKESAATAEQQKRNDTGDTHSAVESMRSDNVPSSAAPLHHLGVFPRLSLCPEKVFSRFEQEQRSLTIATQKKDGNGNHYQGICLAIRFQHSNQQCEDSSRCQEQAQSTATCTTIRPLVIGMTCSARDAVVQCVHDHRGDVHDAFHLSSGSNDEAAGAESVGNAKTLGACLSRAGVRIVVVDEEELTATPVAAQPPPPSSHPLFQYLLSVTEATLRGLASGHQLGLQKFAAPKNSTAPPIACSPAAVVNALLALTTAPPPPWTRRVITSHCPARIGVVGNPSDNFRGKALALTIGNFWATTELLPALEMVSSPLMVESQSPISLIPNPICDPQTFFSLGSLASVSRLDGYSGGLRVLQATCTRLFAFLQSSLDDARSNVLSPDLDLPETVEELLRLCTSGTSGSKVKDADVDLLTIPVGAGSGGSGFALAYRTNIPRQVGLAGSSAMVIATLRALFSHFNIHIPADKKEEEAAVRFEWYSEADSPQPHPSGSRKRSHRRLRVHIAKAWVPSLALSVEAAELGITAGLQDRVAQVYGGLTAMDFGTEIPFPLSSPQSSLPLATAGQFAKTALNSVCGVRGQYYPVRCTGRHQRTAPTTEATRNSESCCLPDMFLAIARDPSDSGKQHANVKQRWLAGDPLVVAAARQWASLVDACVRTIEDNMVEEDEEETVAIIDAMKGPTAPTSGATTSDATTSGATGRKQADKWSRFTEAIDANFNLRRDIYGDPCLGAKNLAMIEICRRHGAAAKFPGSGGAVLVVPPPTVDVWAMASELEQSGFFLIRVQPVGVM